LGQTEFEFDAAKSAEKAKSTSQPDKPGSIEAGSIEIGPQVRVGQKSPREHTERFIEFHEAHPEIYEHYKKLADIAFSRGHTHFGIGNLTEVVRWDIRVKGGLDFKINNSFRAYYARMLAAEFPEYRDWFELRHSGADNPLFYDYLKQKFGIEDPVAILR